MKTNINFWSYLAKFFQEWEMFQNKSVEKINTNILRASYLFIFFPENHSMDEKMWQNRVVR
jgi:hypothetical protein